jgi:tRNA pseudouridine55 synthase
MMMGRPASGLILLDKPEGISSHTAVGKIRRLLQMKTVGHTGTLDPMATGLLPICFGRATRAVEFMIDHDKRYLAGLRLGIETDTGDTTGQVLSKSERTATAEEVAAVLSHFQGTQQQIPPMYSAIKQEGQKLYELARKGVTVERAPREITIYHIELVSADEENQNFLIDVSCSKGTYIRVLCEDIGRRLGTKGVMSSLRRTQAGRYSIANAYTLEAMEEMAAAGDYSFALPTDAIFSDLPDAYVKKAGETRIRNGLPPRKFEIEKTALGPCRIYGPGGFLALGEGLAEGGIQIVKSFFEVPK